MTMFKWAISVCLITVTCASTKPEFWKGTPLDSAVEKMRSSCEEEDTLACFQLKAFTFLDRLLKGEYFQSSDSVEMQRNSYQPNEINARSDDVDLLQGIEEFMKSYDVKFKVPSVGSVTVDSRSLDRSEIDLKLNFGSQNDAEARKKKSKIKKIFTPILVFVLLKAITLVPLAIGILGLKAWNGLQLSFFSFVISTGLAIFQLCQKLAADGAHAHAHISAPGPWETPVHIAAARELNVGQEMAYSAYNV